MWGRHRPSTDAERALMRWLGPPIAVFALAVLAWQGCVSWKLERKARAEAQTACVASGLSEPECKLKMKQRGDDCWKRHYHPGGKYSKSYLNTAGYQACMLETEPVPPLQ